MANMIAELSVAWNRTNVQRIGCGNQSGDSELLLTSKLINQAEFLLFFDYNRIGPLYQRRPSVLFLQIIIFSPEQKHSNKNVFLINWQETVK